FGRGGGGGVVNRVVKEARFMPLREVTLLGGSHTNKRFTTDFDQPLNDRFAVRLTGMYEKSGTFRRFVDLDRSGINPTMVIAASQRTMITLGYEHFRDDRVADRGIPSFHGQPADVD